MARREHNSLKIMVGASGFEPPTSWSRTTLNQTKSVELTAFACAFSPLIWATWATKSAEILLVTAGKSLRYRQNLIIRPNRWALADARNEAMTPTSFIGVLPALQIESLAASWLEAI